MRISRYLLVASTLFLLGIAALVTIDVYRDDTVFYVIALWSSVLALVLSLVIVFRAYQRVITRLGTAGERLAEIKYLQERRYQQLSQRLDYTNDYLRLLKALIQKSGSRASSSSSDVSENLSELEDLNARFQRAERRILGKLEDELYASRRLSRQLDGIVSRLEKGDSN